MILRQAQDHENEIIPVPENSFGDRLLRRGAFVAVMVMAAALLSVGLTLYRPNLASAQTRSADELSALSNNEAGDSPQKE